ncbi:MAG: winged helix DNA-binding domain-containing protein, partial [Ilumatobacteraceae bacterium]
AEIVEHLTGRELSTRELRDALSHLGGTFTAAPGTKWSAEVPTMSRLLTILTATGVVVRGHNAGNWRISRPLWTSMATWLGHDVTPVDASTAYVNVVRQWLTTFGPATEADLVWWLGSTKTTVRSALVALDAAEVAFEDGRTGWVLPDDTADLETEPDIEPWVALLPTLDPTTMGWREREFYLDPAHTPYLFDNAGNGGTTVWIDGRIVGCWVQDDRGRVQPVLLEPLSQGAQRMLDAEVARLDAFLDGQRITNVFASPQMKRQRLR